MPIGGVGVVYRHAEELARRGHEVTIVAPRRGNGPRGAALHAAIRVRDRRHGVQSISQYSARDVVSVEVASPSRIRAHGFDAVVATGHQTAPWVAEAVAHHSARPYYFIQHDERYLSTRAERSWHLPLTKITIATWLADLLQSKGEHVAAVVPNAIDPADYSLDQPLEGRSNRVIALYHRLAVKGPDTLIGALEHLRTLVPDVGADIISARPPQHKLPSWVDVHIRPSKETLRRLYNQAAIGLHTSRLEGWGLVPMEAGACGCAIVGTASRGLAEFLRAGQSMLEVPVADERALAAAAAELLHDQSARMRIALAAIDDIARFSWEDSTDRFESALLQEV